MNFLIDTNIVIPLEPCESDELHVNLEQAMDLYRLIHDSSNFVFIHPSIHYDLDRDTKKLRANMRRSSLGRYQELQAPPDVSIVESTIGTSVLHSNDWVDNNLLSSVYGNAVDCLVTEDKGIHKKAKRLNISDRVYFLEDAIQFLRNLFDISPFTPPHVDDMFLHQIDVNDKIFNSLREDYPFNAWFAEKQREQRKAYVIKDENNELAGICIRKEENCLPDGTIGKVLKLCTFKISEEHGGNRYGELLFKSVFNYVKENNYDYVYFTAYSKQEFLINFAQDFGFQAIGDINGEDELVLLKKFKSTLEDYQQLSAFKLHQIFGPHIFSYKENNSFIIPIKPQWHKILFPEYEPEVWLPTLAPNFSCGNGIKKAYLSNSQTTLLKKGDNIFFYKSKELQGITTVAIVEDVFRSHNPNEIASYVGKRTVYRFEQIEELCNKNSVLAIKFRFVSFLNQAILLKELIDTKIIKRAPQSITQIQSENIECLQEKIKV